MINEERKIAGVKSLTFKVYGKRRKNEKVEKIKKIWNLTVFVNCYLRCDKSGDLMIISSRISV